MKRLCGSSLTQKSQAYKVQTQLFAWIGFFNPVDWTALHQASVLRFHHNRSRLQSGSLTGASNLKESRLYTSSTFQVVAQAHSPCRSAGWLWEVFEVVNTMCLLEAQAEHIRLQEQGLNPEP